MSAPQGSGYAAALDVISQSTGDASRKQSRDLAAGVVTAIFRLVKLATLHSMDNQAMVRQVDETVQIVGEYGARAGHNVSILFAQQSVFVGGQLLRANRGVYEGALELGEILGRVGGAELGIMKEARAQDFYAFASALADALRHAKPPKVERPSPRIRLRPLAASALGREMQNWDEGDPTTVVARTYASAIVIMRRFFEQVRKGKYELPQRLKRVAQRLVDLSSGETPAFLGVTAARNANQDEAGRAVNTAIMSLAMVRQITTDVGQLVRIAMAALLYDCARARLAGMVGEGGPIVMPQLSEQQENDAPAGTAVVITALSRVNEPGVMRTVMTYEAHWVRRAKRLGPLYRGLRPPSLQARIIHVARAFNDALTPAPGETPPSADEVVARLEREAADTAERTVLRLLIGALGIFPTGTLVELSTGEVALVTQTPLHPSRYSQPRVRLVIDAQGGALPRPVDIDLAQKPRAGEPVRTIRRVVATSDDPSAAALRAHAAQATPSGSGIRPQGSEKESAYPSGLTPVSAVSGIAPQYPQAQYQQPQQAERVFAPAVPDPRAYAQGYPPQQQQQQQYAQPQYQQQYQQPQAYAPQQQYAPPPQQQYAPPPQQQAYAPPQPPPQQPSYAPPAQQSYAPPPDAKRADPTRMDGYPAPAIHEEDEHEEAASEGGQATRAVDWQEHVALLERDNEIAHEESTEGGAGDAPEAEAEATHEPEPTDAHAEAASGDEIELDADGTPNIPPTAEGSFGKTPLVHLLVYMLDQRLSGTTLITSPEGTRHILYFHDGAVSKIKTGSMAAPLDRVILDQGLLDEDTLRGTLMEISKKKILHGRLLVQKGLLKSDVVMSMLRLQLHRKVTTLFEMAPETTYAYYDGLNLLADYGASELTAYEPLAVIMSGVRLRANDRLVDATLERIAARPISLHVDAQMKRFELHKDEQAIVDLLRTRPMSLAEILDAGVARQERVVRMTLYALAITRHLDLGVAGKAPVGAGFDIAAMPPRQPEDGPKVKPYSPEAAKPKPPPPAAPPVIEQRQKTGPEKVPTGQRAIAPPVEKPKREPTPPPGRDSNPSAQAGRQNTPPPVRQPTPPPVSGPVGRQKTGTGQAPSADQPVGRQKTGTGQAPGGDQPVGRQNTASGRLGGGDTGQRQKTGFGMSFGAPKKEAPKAEEDKPQAKPTTKMQRVTAADVAEFTSAAKRGTNKVVPPAAEPAARDVNETPAVQNPPWRAQGPAPTYEAVEHDHFPRPSFSPDPPMMGRRQPWGGGQEAQQQQHYSAQQSYPQHTPPPYPQPTPPPYPQPTPPPYSHAQQAPQYPQQAQPPPYPQQPQSALPAGYAPPTTQAAGQVFAPSVPPPRMSEPPPLPQRQPGSGGPMIDLPIDPSARPMQPGNRVNTSPGVSRPVTGPQAPPMTSPGVSQKPLTSPGVSSGAPSPGGPRMSQPPNLTTNPNAPRAITKPPEKPAAPAAPLPGDPAKRAEIETRANEIDSEDFFTILGVERKAPPDKIQKAYFALAKAWHPDRVPSDLQDLKPQVARVFARLNEAYQTLNDPQKRKDYEAVVAQGGGAADDSEKVARIVDAALEFQKAEILMKKHDLAGAEALAKRAVQADPDQPDYVTLLTWITAQRRGDPPPLKEGQTTTHYDDLIRTLDGILKKEPHFERALFYRGMLQKRAGRADKAMRDFRQVAELNPKNIDAVREVRLYEMRKRGKKGGDTGGGEGGLFGKFFKR